MDGRDGSRRGTGRWPPPESRTAATAATAYGGTVCSAVEAALGSGCRLRAGHRNVEREKAKKSRAGSRSRWVTTYKTRPTDRLLGSRHSRQVLAVLEIEDPSCPIRADLVLFLSRLP